jgi:2-desacetyl-2-hydroxyethyl bacteriochlorophyllide A dehydrogenase
MDDSLAVILEKPHQLAVRRIPVPPVGESSIRVEMRACGICGSDVRYLAGENPWSLHTLGKSLPSPPDMVLGHEVSGVVNTPGGSRRVAILAIKGCGKCLYCSTGRENMCDATEHFGHSAGWPEMAYYPGGMSERFDIWKGFEYDIPDSISFEAATFLDGLAVAVHGADQGRIGAGSRVGVVGLGPIGVLSAQVARQRGASLVTGCDPAGLPVEMCRAVGLADVVRGDTGRLLKLLQDEKKTRLDAVLDTVGTPETIQHGLEMLDKSGVLVLLSVHEEPFPLAPVRLSGERSIVSAANNTYPDFPAAIQLLASGKVVVDPLVTHRFPLAEARQAFQTMLEKEKRKAFKVVLHP